jgi:phage-related protein (TIGR01555 family)
MTHTSFKQDGYLDAVMGSRAAMPTFRLSDTAMYAEGGLPARVVDLPADSAVKGGVTVTGDADGIVAAELDRLKVLPLLADAARWSRLQGGGCLVLIGADGGTLRDPINPGRLDTIDELRAFDVNDVSVDRTYNDPTQRNYGQPELYRLAVRGAGSQVLVHESRLIPVPGEPLPAAMRRDSIPWRGRSAASRPFARIRDYTDAVGLAREILRRKQQGVYKMEGLAQAIQSEQEGVVQKRIAMVDQARGVLNTVAVDSEDDYSIQDTNVSGVNALLQEFQIALSAEAGIAVTLLFGRSPGGQNSTGDADFEGFYNLVEQLRTLRMQPALERIIALICAQRSLAGKAPQNWAVAWNPLKQLSDKEQADTDKTRAEALKTVAEAVQTIVGTSALSEDETREYLQQRGLFGLVPDDNTPGTAASYAGAV